jgi:RNA polymerase sigma-70 factor, ECF subfamily
MNAFYCGDQSHMQTDQSQLNTEPATDRDLVHSAKAGEMAAFEELVRRHTKRVFSIAYHITHSRQDAEEVSQETFLKACCHLKDFEEKAQFSTWLTRIAVNTALCTVARSDRFRVAVNKERSGEPGCLREEVPDWRENPEQLYARSQLRRLLQQALEKLSPAYSTVFLLRDMQGLSIAETAAALQLNVPVVKTRLLRARLQLRENLSKSFIPTWSKTGHARSNLVARVRPFSAQSAPTKAPLP